MVRTRIWPVLLAVGGLIAYFVLFYCVEMPGLTQATGKTFVRGQLLEYLLVPESLVECWLGTPAGFSLADRLPVLVIAAGIVGWGLAAGWLVLRAGRLGGVLTRLESLVFSAAVGLNALSTYVLAIGLAGWLNRAAVAAPAAVTFVAALCLWRGRTRRSDPPQPTANATSNKKEKAEKRQEGNRTGSPFRVTSGMPSHSSPPTETETSSVPRLGYWLAAPFLAVLLLGAMLPPVEFDVREYHLQAPKEFYQQSSIGFLPHNVYANMPLGTEMLSLLGMVVAGDWWLGALVGKTVIASYAVLTALGLLAAGRRFAGRAAGAVAALVYLTVPWVVQVSTLGLVDVALGCYLFLAFYAACLAMGPATASLPASPLAAEARSADRPVLRTQYSVLILAGYLAGGAVACKYPGMLFAVLPLACWVSFAFRDAALPRWRIAWKPAAVLLLAAAVGCGLWFAKNWTMTGNPTYPLLYSAFGGETWTPEKDRQWNQVHRPHDFSPEALGRDMARVALTSEWLSPLVVPLAALGLAFRSRRRLAIGLAVYVAFIIAAWWLLTHRIDRFWIPALPLAALLAGLAAVWSPERLWRITVVVLLILGSVANFVAVSSIGGGYNRYFVSLARLRDDPERVDVWHRYLNEHAKGGRVLLVGDAQPFDLEMPVLYNTCFDDCIFEQLVKGRSPQAIRAVLADRGITHVYVNWGEIARYRRTYGFTDFVQPAVFDELASAGILAPLPEIPNSSGRGYRVVPPPS